MEREPLNVSVPKPENASEEVALMGMLDHLCRGYRTEPWRAERNEQDAEQVRRAVKWLAAKYGDPQ